MLFHYPRLMLSPDGADGGAPPATPPATPPAAADPPPATPAAVQQSYDNLLSRNNGDSSIVSWMLFNEAQANRAENENLRTQVATLTAQIPAEADLLLTGDDVALWASYSELGTPEEIAQGRTAYQTLQSTMTIRDAAQLNGFKESVLTTLVSQNNVVIAIEENKDDDNGRSAFVVTDEGQDNVPLADYVTENWADFAPSLKLGDPGTPFVRQHTGNKKPSGTAVTNELDKRYKD